MIAQGKVHALTRFHPLGYSSTNLRGRYVLIMASMYPAIKAGIGRWTYYIVKLKFGDLAKEVALSSDVHQHRTLDDAIQREVNDSRAKAKPRSIFA